MNNVKVFLLFLIILGALIPSKIRNSHKIIFLNMLKKTKRTANYRVDLKSSNSSSDGEEKLHFKSCCIIGKYYCLNKEKHHFDKVIV